MLRICHNYLMFQVDVKLGCCHLGRTRRLRVFENRVLRWIFGTKREEVTGEWKKLHNEELHDLYSPTILLVIKLRKMRWTGHVALLGDGEGVYRVLVGKPEGKRPLGRPRHRCENEIKMDHQEVGCRSMDWIGLAQDRDRWRALVNVEHLGSIKCGTFLD
jgi:hypothetical protein